MLRTRAGCRAAPATAIESSPRIRAYLAVRCPLRNPIARRGDGCCPFSVMGRIAFDIRQIVEPGIDAHFHVVVARLEALREILRIAERAGRGSFRAMDDDGRRKLRRPAGGGRGDRTGVAAIDRRSDDVGPGDRHLERPGRTMAPTRDGHPPRIDPGQRPQERRQPRLLRKTVRRFSIPIRRWVAAFLASAVAWVMPSNASSARRPNPAAAKARATRRGRNALPSVS